MAIALDNGLRCSKCDARIDTCDLCGKQFTKGEVIRCTSVFNETHVCKRCV